MPLIGEIRMFAGNFAPRGWALCEGQVLPISKYASLYSVLGVSYGGNGQTTFQLPDLRGRAAVHPGVAPGLAHTGVEGAAGEVDPKERAFTEVRFVIALDGSYPVRD